LLRDFHSGIDFDPRISGGTIQLGLIQGSLDSPQLLCSAVNQRRLDPALRMHAALLRVAAGHRRPAIDYSSILMGGWVD
jgi:hypothetical protein